MLGMNDVFECNPKFWYSEEETDAERDSQQESTWACDVLVLSLIREAKQNYR